MMNLTDTSPPAGPAKSPWRLWLGVLLVGTILYAATAQRGVSWQDSGMFQWRVLQADFHGELGLALAHPLYIAAGQVCRIAGPEHLPMMLNMFSGLGMALAAANCAAVALLWTSRRWIAWATAGMLLVAHTAWWLATIAEVYTWSVAGLTAEIWLLSLLLRRPTSGRLAGLAFLSGLGVCIHNFALLPLPVYLVVAIGLIVRKQLKPSALALAAAAWVLGAGPYLAMVAQLAIQSGDWGFAIHSALFGEYAEQVLNVAGRSSNFKANMALTALNFISLLGPLALVGFARLPKRLGGGLGWAVLGLTGVELAFFIRYNVPDQFTFFLPSLVMLVLAAGVGLDWLAGRSGTLGKIAIVSAVVSVVLPPAAYGFGPRLLRAAGVKIQRSRSLPYRDEMRYWIVPWKHNEDSAERFARAGLDQADGHVILADTTSMFPLHLRRQLGDRAVEVWPAGHKSVAALASPTRLSEALDGRGLFVVSPGQGNIPAWLAAADLPAETRDGPLRLILPPQ
ncbi:MAG: hypothetical protein ACOCZE_11055, partial [Planctomycetota bacterium]